MTDPIIRSKKCRTLILFVAGLFWTLPLRGQDNLPKVPVVHQLGVLPVQLETGGDAYDMQQLQGKLDQIFPKVARDAQRFRVLNDDLVRGLWETPEGRSELKTQFELQGYLSLTMVPRADTVTVGCRLLGPDLQNYLLETELYQRSWLMNAPDEEIRVKLEELVFRVINRIPIDVSITSVQGPYITLSGGEEQGIARGDSVSLIRAGIKSLHPANGTWVGFKIETLGEAKIIEVKEHSSVAKLSKITHISGLEIGDGAKIPAIAGRVKFARMAQKESFVDSGNQETILVPPLYQGNPATPNPDAAAIAKPIPKQQSAANKPADENDQQPRAREEQEEPVVAESEEDDSSIWEGFEFSSPSSNIVDELQVAVGPHWWNTKGRAGVPASGKFPIWIINHIEASVSRALIHKIKIGFGGGVNFGNTDNGSYTGYDSHAKIYWREPLAEGGFFSYWEAGGLGRFSGTAVDGENFGGGDFIRAGGFGALGGTLNLGSQYEVYDWFGQLDLMPMNIGRFGYNGSQKTVESTFGWQVAIGAFQRSRQAIEFGGRLRIFSETMTLSDDSRPQLNQSYLEALARMKI